MSEYQRPHKRTRAQESSNAIERLYITMRHLFNRGFYKPMGVSGETLREALLELRPEIYGSIAEEKTELIGLKYVMDRLPQGIEECTYINLTSDEGYKSSHFEPIIPHKRRRNCYRIDREQMTIEITRGRSEIYDILTHLTFLFIESHKICKRILIDELGTTSRDWQKIRKVVLSKLPLTETEREISITHVANVLGHTFKDINAIYDDYATPENPDHFLSVIYWLGELAIVEETTKQKRVVTFSRVLRERIGHHIHGEKWANNIKTVLKDKGLINRPIHIISANLHSVMNTLYGKKALKDTQITTDFDLYEILSLSNNKEERNRVKDLALKEGMYFLKDVSGTNIDVQIFDTEKIDLSYLTFCKDNPQKPIIFVMDYAFGEQAYETIDELLKPFNDTEKLDVISVSIMGKAGILDGAKGDIMIPSAHVFEGTSGNYPFKNELSKSDFKESGIDVFEGTMVTVLGTSLQNKDILDYFHHSTWNVIGLEMEGGHYQKAIQSASKIRCSINENVKVRYAYYASDNPLKTGSTLASGGLGTTGVKPTYTITHKILEQIFNN